MSGSRYIHMEEYFHRTTACEIDTKQHPSFITFYCKVQKLGTTCSNWVLVEDSGKIVVVDFSNLESILVEKGEYYRFCGEACTPVKIDGHSTPRVLLHLNPVHIDGYCNEIYERSLQVKRSFLSGFDALIAFGLMNE